MWRTYVDVVLLFWFAKGFDSVLLGHRPGATLASHYGCLFPRRPRQTPHGEHASWSPRQHVLFSTHIRRETDDTRWCINHRFQPGGSVWWRKTGSSLFTLIQMGVCWIVQKASLLFPDISPSPIGARAYLSHAGWNEDYDLMEFGSLISSAPSFGRKVVLLHPFVWQKSHCISHIIRLTPKLLYVEKHWAF